MNKNNESGICCRDGFEIHPNYFGEENQDKAPYETEPAPQEGQNVQKPGSDKPPVPSIMPPSVGGISPEGVKQLIRAVLKNGC